MILAISVVVDESKYLGILASEFLIVMVHLPFLTWVWADTASAACPAHPGSLDMMSVIFAAVICDADDPCSVNTAYEPESSFYNVTSEYEPAFALLILGFQLRILEMTEVHYRCKVYDSALIPCFLDRFLFVSDFRQLPCWDFLQFFPFFLHCRLCILNLKCLRHRNEFVHKTVMSCRILPFRSDVILMRLVSSCF